MAASVSCKPIAKTKHFVFEQVEEILNIKFKLCFSIKESSIYYPVQLTAILSGLDFWPLTAPSPSRHP